jgi:biopolymer transport protein ExbD
MNYKTGGNSIVPDFTGIFDGAGDNFSITPVIDIVFLLIIFFLLVCRFIETKPQQVNLPVTAESIEQIKPKTAEVVITISQSGEKYINGSEIYPSPDYPAGQLIKSRINTLLEKSQSQKRTADLKIDKFSPCTEFKDILQAVSESNIEDVRLSVIQQNH